MTITSLIMVSNNFCDPCQNVVRSSASLLFQYCFSRRLPVRYRSCTAHSKDHKTESLSAMRQGFLVSISHEISWLVEVFFACVFFQSCFSRRIPADQPSSAQAEACNMENLRRTRKSCIIFSPRSIMTGSLRSEKFHLRLFSELLLFEK